MTEALSLSGVDALYGESHVLHGVSFSLNLGRVLALLGRNGAGKTTCMSAIIGFLPPRGGEVRLFGEPIGRLSPETISRKGVGFVPQGRRIFSTLTVRENLAVSRQKRAGVAVPWDLERVIELFPRLKERLQQMAGSLSGGEQQMLAIGRALMGNPRLLLMDDRRRSRPHHRAPEAGRPVDSPGRAEHQARPRPRRRGRDPQHRPRRVQRQRRPGTQRPGFDHAASRSVLANRSEERND